jgi:hypothetical protein
MFPDLRGTAAGRDVLLLIAAEATEKRSRQFTRTMVDLRYAVSDERYRRRILMRMFTPAMALVVVLLLPASEQRVDAIVPAVSAATDVSAADAAPFLGEWTLALQGPNGPGTFTLWITAEKDKVSAEIASDTLARQAVSTISMSGKSLVLNYAFTWEGNPVQAVATLTPDKEGKTTAQMDFAGGAYVMNGSATKKEKEK